MTARKDLKSLLLAIADDVFYGRTDGGTVDALRSAADDLGTPETIGHLCAQWFERQIGRAMRDDEKIVGPFLVANGHALDRVDAALWAEYAATVLRISHLDDARLAEHVAMDCVLSESLDMESVDGKWRVRKRDSSCWCEGDTLADAVRIHREKK